jgi:prepilin-type N-terminal cleavage/methylation domain-containing protein
VVTTTSGARGFSLIEALIALVLVGIALMLDLGLQAQSREIEDRLAVEAELLRRAEAVIESVRAGEHPLRSGAIDPARAWPNPAPPELAMIVVVDRTEVSGLCRVTVRGQMRGKRDRPHDVELETLIWRAGAPCQ